MRVIQLIMCRASHQSFPTCSVLFGRLGFALINALHSITEDAQFRALPMYSHDNLVMIRRGVLVLVANNDRIAACQCCRNRLIFFEKYRDTGRDI
ncbi:hypothetical protein SAMN04488094_1442 [Tropicimonas isoalkanivorans]|uniref:Uncharacterized protein n=1 Tax=Tropicimonas isoalkanivorans TaxID=441112 RepID=A0A1I1RNC7_9RHOB|nr:hypothetical protein SAMN04488094_1442 [Tropicimonas isoalkanivorans]